MENALETIMIAVGVIIAAVIISMCMIISNRGTSLFNSHTQDVSESANMIARIDTGLYNGNIVSTDTLIAAAQDFSEDYEIRYQTNMHRNGNVAFRVYPGTAQGEAESVEIEDPRSADYLNPDATWVTSINEDEGYIMFTQEAA